MSTVVALIAREHAFNPQAIQAMSLALDDICVALRFTATQPPAK